MEEVFTQLGLPLSNWHNIVIVGWTPLIYLIRGLVLGEVLCAHTSMPADLSCTHTTCLLVSSTASRMLQLLTFSHVTPPGFYQHNRVVPLWFSPLSSLLSLPIFASLLLSSSLLYYVYTSAVTRWIHSSGLLPLPHIAVQLVPMCSLQIKRCTKLPKQINLI